MAIIINGKRFSGSNLSIVGGRVIVDGKTQDGTVDGVVEVRITEGVPVSVQSDAAVHCGEVAGNVKAGMGISCGDVSGDINADMGVSMGRRR